MESCVVEMRGGQIGTVSAPSRFESESIRPAIRPGCESPTTHRIEITQISSPERSTLKKRVSALSAAISYAFPGKTETASCLYLFMNYCMYPL